MNANKILEEIDELERRFLIGAVRAQQNLHEAMGGHVTYGELQSFEIARHHGVTVEQFAALPSRADRMKWLEERNAKIYGAPKEASFFETKD